MTAAEVFVGEGPLSELADRASAEGFHFVQVRGTVFRIEEGRAPGSSLKLTRVPGQGMK